MRIKLGNYGQYSNAGHGAHTITLSADDLVLYFSYQTVVAFYHPNTGLVVSKNIWSTTTGRHLNWIDGGTVEDRIECREMRLLLAKIMDEMGLVVE